MRWQDMDPEDLKTLRNRQWKDMFAEIESEKWEIVQLWRQGAPNFREEYEQGQPRMAIMPKHTGAPRGMFLICAGGGFGIKSFNEAKPVAERFHELGFNTAILDYRLMPYTRLDACDDAKRAIRYLRANAEMYNTLPDRIAIGGFSAGGQLSGYAATLFDYGNPDAQDELERVSCRPDAAIVCYGAFSPAAHSFAGIGYDAKAQNERAKLSIDKNLRPDSPPFFLFQTALDDPRSVLTMGKELADRGIPFEAHIFEGGSHGNGLYDGRNDTEDVKHTAHWSMLAAEWLKGLGF